MEKQKRTFVNEKVFKALVVLLIPIVFALGLVYRLKTDFYNSVEKMPLHFGVSDNVLNCQVYSTSQIARQIEKYSYVKVPRQATNLYCAVGYDFGKYSYSALSLPTKQQCMEFLKIQLGIWDDDINSATLKKGFIECAPDTWSENFRGNWDLRNYSEYYFFEKTGFGQQKVIYVPEHHRIFIYED